MAFLQNADCMPTFHQNCILVLISCVFLCIPAEELVKAERGDISELMTTSFSETRTTEELLPAESEEEKDDEEEEERAFQNRPYPPRIGTYSFITHATTHISNIL